MQSDVYAFSFLIYEILYNKKPFNDLKTIESIKEKICDENLRPKCKSNRIPECYKSLIQKCWSKNLKKRPTFNNIIDILKSSIFLDSLESSQKDKFINYINFLESKDAISNPIDIQNFQKLSKIYKDSVKEVCIIQEKTTNKLYSANFYNYKKTQNMQAFEKQIKLDRILSNFKFPSILQYVGYSLHNINLDPYLTVINEYAKNSLNSILDHCFKKNPPPEWNSTKKMINLYGIAAGMHFIHSKNIIHCSLSCDSILEDENFYPKITSFDSIHNINDDLKNEKNYFNFYTHESPEVIHGKNYSKKSDVYSFSMILYQIITNKTIEGKNDSNRIIQLIFLDRYRPEFNSDINKYHKKLIELCWSDDPDNRPTFLEIMKKLKKSKYIIEGTDLNEYYKYVDFIDKKLDSVLENPYHLNSYFNDYHNDFYQININEYEILETMSSNRINKFCRIQNKITKKKFVAQIIKKKIDHFSTNYTFKILSLLKSMSKLDHPSIIKFVGISTIDFINKPRLVILTEDFQNLFLYKILEERRNEFYSPPNWNILKEMIILFGIASFMHYLKIQNINIQCLSTHSIVLDESFYPKFLFDFQYIEVDEDDSSDSTEYSEDSEDQFNEEADGIKIIETDANDINEANLVFHYSLIMFEIMTNIKPYDNDNISLYLLLQYEKRKERPEFDNEIPEYFENLICKCWLHNPKERPSFSDILDTLKTITFIEILKSNYQRKEYFDYIYLIESKNQNSTTYLNIYNYKLLDQISQNYYSQTYKILENSTGKILAAKSYLYNNIENRNKMEKQLNINNITSKLDHPAILKYIGYSLYNFKFEPYLTLINEYASNSLYNILSLERKGETPKGWNSTKKLINIYGIAAALEYLHNNKVIHRNLSIKNILVDDNFYPKLTGFNEIQILEADTINSDKFVGYSRYAAPEVISNKIYSKKSDVYSFSIILYEIIANKKPFLGFKSDNQLFKAILKGFRPDFNSSIPKCYKNLIESCWSENPYMRPTFTQIVYKLKKYESFREGDINVDEFSKYIEMINPHNKHEDEDDKEELQENKMKYVDINNYEKRKKIGGGGFSNVFEVYDKMQNKMYAAKIYNESNKKYDQIMLSRELKIMFNLDFPSIIKIFGFSPIDFKHRSRPTLILELGKCTLYDILDLERKGSAPHEWNETKKHINIYGIAACMEYLHSLNIIYRDLKPENVLEDDYLFPKITDFGLSKINSENNIKQSGPDLKGTLAYMSPELIKDRICTKENDIYAFGMMLYEIITGEVLFNGQNIYSFLLDVINGHRPEFNGPILEHYKDLIKACWANDPKDRPQFSEIVKMLKTEKFLINVDRDEFFDYVDYVDNYHLNKSVQEHKFEKIESELKIKKDNSFINIPSDIMQIDITQFKKKEKLGHGGFANVYKVINKTSNEILAAKVLKNEFTDLNENDQINFVRELEVISKLHHKSVMKFVGYSKNDFKNKPKPVILSEIVVNGSLSNVLELENRGCAVEGWDDTKKLINIYGIAVAMKYMHSNSFIHRDLKPENILLDEHLFPKIADFGLSKVLTKKVCEFNSKALGTPPYIAPEIWISYEFSKASDVYAFGMILYEIMTNEKACNEIKIKERICLEVAGNGFRPKIKCSIPKCYQDLIEKCWSQEPKKRPSFDEIVDILKTDPNFIMNTINLDEFVDYTELIGENYLLVKDSKKQNEQPRTEILEMNLKKYIVTNTKEKINELSISKFNKVIEVEMKSEYFLDLNNYEQKEIIRKGEFSKVFKVIRKDTGEIYSARLSNIDMTQFKEEDMTNIVKEFNEVSKLNHPSIIHFVGFSPYNFKKEPKPIVISELLSNKTLNDILLMDRKNLKIPNWDSTKKLINIYCIAAGMKYLHSHNIIHRNLKPNNIIMDDNLIPKLFDFGLCTHLLIMNSMTFQTSSKASAPPIYSAPEILLTDERTKESDVYAFGMITYEIITKNHIKTKSNDFSGFISDVVNKSKRPEFNVQIEESYRELIESCWAENPEERPTFKEIIEVLESNKDFITPDIDEKEFHTYIAKLSSLSL